MSLEAARRDARPARRDTTFLDPLVRDKKVIVCCGAGGVGKTTTAAAIGVASAVHGPQGPRPHDRSRAPARRGDGDPGGRAYAFAGAAREARRARRSRSGRALRVDAEPRGRLRIDGAAPRDATRRACRRSWATASTSTSRRSSPGCRSTRPPRRSTRSRPRESTISSSSTRRPRATRSSSSRRRASSPCSSTSASSASSCRRRARSCARPPTSIERVFTRAFGEGFYKDLQGFLGAFSGMFGGMRAHAEAVRTLLTSDDAAFLLVTSPEPAALAEASFFQAKIKELGLPFAGYVLNRSWAYTRGFSGPEEIQLAPERRRDRARRPEKLGQLADARAMASPARSRPARAPSHGRPTSGAAIATPHLGGAVEDLVGLARACTEPRTPRECLIGCGERVAAGRPTPRR